MDVKVTSAVPVKEAFLLLEQLTAHPLGPVLEAVQFLMVHGAWLFKLLISSVIEILGHLTYYFFLT